MRVVGLTIILLSVYSTNHLGVLVCQKQGGHAVLEHYVLAMELWVHVSRLPVPHVDSDQWKHFILNILLLMGGDVTHIFTSILLLHALHTLDCNCTCQNNPRLSFRLFWWCGRLFLSSLHTIILHMCASFHLTHHHSSKISFCHVGGGVILLLCLLLTHHHLHVSSHITHHNFHPNVMCSFICTKLQAPVVGVGFY